VAGFRRRGVLTAGAASSPPVGAVSATGAAARRSALRRAMAGSFCSSSSGASPAFGSMPIARSPSSVILSSISSPSTVHFAMAS
jgi:hypothetical protein